MKRKVQKITEQVCERLKTWETVECVTFMDIMDENYSDPYFFISMDVFYNDAIPGPEERVKLLPGAAIFETSILAQKDRFLMDNIPVRIEYRSVKRLNVIFNDIQNSGWVFHQTGTFMFYRIKNGKVLYVRSDWFQKLQDKVVNFPRDFWDLMVTASQASMEHCLSDLGAAALAGDPYFFLVSSAGFLKGLCSMIFALNRELEPSERVLHKRIMDLPELPANFRGLFTSFLSSDIEFPMARKKEVAQLLAKGAISLA